MANSVNLFSSVDNEGETRSTVFLQRFQSASVADELIATAKSLVHPRGRGIYATDESPDVCEDILVVASGADQTTRSAEEKLERRRAWRKDAYESVSSEFISGVILYPETLLDFGLAPILISKGIIPGVRANGELVPFQHSPSEFIVQGLDDLLSKLQAARAAGARFSKWRVPIACTRSDLPTETALNTHAETLASFSAISQQAGLVPIVEPDVEFSGDADLVRSVQVHQKVIRKIFSRCLERGVLLEGTLIKPSFPQPGLQHPSRATVTPQDIGLATASVIANSVPISVSGVVFLSGGLPPSVAASYLAATNQVVNSATPTSSFSRLPPLSFSFGRAMQGQALEEWTKGDTEAVRRSLDEMSRVCWKAAQGILI